jgi:hypothetical protein
MALRRCCRAKGWKALAAVDEDQHAAVRLTGIAGAIERQLAAGMKGLAREVGVGGPLPAALSGGGVAISACVTSY